MAAGQAWAVDAVVTTIDGKTYSGEVLTDDSTGITLINAGIKAPIPRKQIQNVEYLPSIGERYLQRRSEISDDDLDGRYALAYWLFENKEYELASQELDSLAEIFPADSRVTQLRGIVEARLVLHQQSLEDQQQGQADPTQPAVLLAEDAQTSDPSQPQTQARPLLTGQQINLIKVYEIELSKKPKVIVPPEVLDKAFSDYEGHPSVPKDTRQLAAIRKSPGYKQLELLFSLRARELYSRVKVVGDPPVMNGFRTTIHQRYVLNYCGTVTCHGNPDTQKLPLFRLQPNREATVYTNFLTLQSTTAGGQDVINRQKPENSLLLQYALTPSQSATPHPAVPGWQPRFQSKQDEFYQSIVRWIGSLWKPTPDYGIVRSSSETETESEPQEPPLFPRKNENKDEETSLD